MRLAKKKEMAKGKVQTVINHKLIKFGDSEYLV